MKIVKTVIPPKYQFIARCTRQECVFKVGGESVEGLLAVSEAHAFVTGHLVHIEDREGA